MDFSLFKDRFDSSFVKFLDQGLINNPQLGSEFRSKCYGLISQGIESGQIGPDFMPDELGYCKVLTVAGYLEERGNKMVPTHYIPTSRARDLMRGC